MTGRPDARSASERAADALAFRDATPLLPITYDLASGRVAFVGLQAEEHLGLDREAWHGATFWEDRVFPDDQMPLAEARSRLRQDGGSHVVDYRMEHADGRIVWTCEIGVAEAQDDGSVSFRGYLLDITERKRQEVALWKNEERLRALLRKAPDALVLTELDGTIINMNEQAEALFDYVLADVAGSSIDHLLPARLRSRLPQLRAAFERDPERRSLVDGHSFAIERADGTEIPVELSMSLVPGIDDARAILCSVRDLTARRRVEAQLRSSQRHLRDIADVLPAMVAFVDTDHRYRFVNDAYARWHGMERRQMEGRLVREVVGESLYKQLLPSVEAALQGQANHFRGTMSAEPEHSIPVDVSLVPQQDESGAVAGYFLVIFDVSDEVDAREADRRHRAELAYVSRVATMGELAASIAHELNQPLSAIVANAQAADRLLRVESLDLRELSAALRDIAADGRRAGEVISSMRQLLQRGEARQESIEVLGLVRDVIELLHSEAIGKGVTLSYEGSDSALPSIMGDAAQLKQVFLNLLMNAIEATSRRAAGPRSVQAIVTLDGAEVEVIVRDNGPGLPAGDSEELFQPFISRRSGGLGMGLSISRTIAEAHGGRLWAEANDGPGAAFILRLPVP